MEHKTGTIESWQEAVQHWGFAEAGRVSLEGGVRITAQARSRMKRQLAGQVQGAEELEERILAELAYAALHDAVRASALGADNWDLLTRVPGEYGTLLYMTLCPMAPGQGEERWVLRGVRHLPLSDGTDPEAQVPEMPVNAQRMLYGFLRESFPAGERLLTSAVGETLNKFEIDYKALGYGKLAQMLAAMDHCVVQLPGRPGKGDGIYLMPDPCWEPGAPALPTAAEIEALLAGQEPAIPEAEGLEEVWAAAPGWKGLEQYGLERVDAALLEQLPTEAGQVYITLNSQKALLNGLCGGTAEETARLSPEQWRTLRENYTLARRLGFARKNGRQEGSYYFPTGFSTPEGEPLMQAVSPKNQEPGKGICVFIGTLKKTRRAESVPAPAPEPVPAEDTAHEWQALEKFGFGTVAPALLEKLPMEGGRVYVAPSAQKNLLEQLGIAVTGTARLSPEQWDALKAGYAKARGCGFARRNARNEQAFDFPIGLTTPAGEPLFMSVSPGDKGDGSGYCGFVGKLSEDRPQPQPGRSLQAPEELSEAEVFIPQTTLNAMYGHLNDLFVDRGDKSLRLRPTDDQMQTLRDSYAKARAAGQLYPMRDGYVFHTDLVTPRGQPLQAQLTPNRWAGAPWVMNRVDLASPRHALDRWAHMGSWDEVLNQLADMALPENWSFEGSDRKQVLKSYLCYTFYRLKLEGKVAESPRLAIFNTGLVNGMYDDIYALFVPNVGNSGGHWRFQAFCVKGEGVWGKNLVRCFSEPPAPARYFTAADLLYDCSKRPQVDKNHIVKERLYRWPLDVLRSELEKPAAVRILDALEAAQTPAERDAGFEKLNAYLDENPLERNHLVECLSAAIERAIKRVRWNYQTALPAYFPGHNTMSLMLPLDLRGSGREDVALVVEKQDNGVYLGATILTLDMAYVDARLICRPDKDWLNNERIREVAGDEEADD